MKLVFNAGTAAELSISERRWASYMTGTDTDHGYGGYWWEDEPVVFDALPLLQAYIADNTKYRVPLLKLNNQVKFNLYFDIAGSDYLVQWETEGGSAPGRHTLDTFPVGSLPDRIGYIFVWENNTLFPNQSRFDILYESYRALPVTLSSALINNQRYIKGVEGNTYVYANHQVAYPGFSIPRPYTSGSVWRDAATYLDKIPSSVYGNTSGVAYLVTAINGDNLEGLTSADGSGPEPIDPEDPIPFDPIPVQPYSPTQDNTSDQVTIPNNPTIGITSAGFINVYNPGMNALLGLGDVLFPNVASATTTTDAILSVVQALLNSRLIDYVIDCHVIPVSPQTGTNQNIKVGFRDTTISVPVVTSDYIDATCGSLNIAEWFSGFQDFLFTTSKLYLPFIGFVEVKPEYWQAGTIKVDYKFNVIDGSFQCYVSSTSSKSALSNSVIAQYSGNACMHFPITGVNYSNMISGIIGAGVGIATGGSSVGILGAASTLANAISRGGDVQQSNGYNSTSAMLGVRKPFLLIERPVPAVPSSYKHDKGLPTNISAPLGTIKGFTVIEDIDLSGIPFTSDELTELRSLLAEGVYF